MEGHLRRDLFGPESSLPKRHRGKRYRIMSWLCTCCPWLYSLRDNSHLQPVKERPVTPYPVPWSHHADETTFVQTHLNAWSLSSTMPRNTRTEDIEFKAIPYSAYTKDGEGRIVSSQPRRANTSKPLPPLPNSPELPPIEVDGRLAVDFQPVDWDPPEPEDAKVQEPPALTRLLEAIDNAFEHIPYAVCGLGGLSVWGFTDRIPHHISIVCSSHSAENIKSWCVVTGGVLYPDEPEYIGLPTAQGQVGRVKIKYLERGFERLKIVRAPIPSLGQPDTGVPQSPFSGGFVRVLSLASLVDQAAQSYMEDMQKPGAHRRRIQLAKNIMWMLRRLRDGDPRHDGMEELAQDNVPHVVKEEFWDLFTHMYPESIALFREAGLPISVTNKPMVSGCKPTDHIEGGYGAQDGPWSGPVFGRRGAGGAMTVFTGLNDEEEQTEKIAVPLPTMEHIPESVEEDKPKDKEVPRLKSPGQTQAQSLTPFVLGSKANEPDEPSITASNDKESRKGKDRKEHHKKHRSGKRDSDRSKETEVSKRSSGGSKQPDTPSSAADAVSLGVGQFADFVREED